MKALKTLLFGAIIFSCSLVANCQQKIEIQDPEFTITMEIPEGWVNLDDGFNLRIYPGDTAKLNYLNFTYFADDGKVNLDTAMFIQENFELPAQNYKMKALSKGQMKLSGYPARWLHFEHGARRRQKAVLYVSLQHGQKVLVSYNATKKNYRKLLPEFKEIVKSIKIVPKLG